MILCRNSIVSDWLPAVKIGLYTESAPQGADFRDYNHVFWPSAGLKLHQSYYLSIKIRRRPPQAGGLRSVQEGPSALRWAPLEVAGAGGAPPPAGGWGSAPGWQNGRSPPLCSLLRAAQCKQARPGRAGESRASARQERAARCGGRPPQRLKSGCVCMPGGACTCSPPCGLAISRAPPLAGRQEGGPRRPATRAGQCRSSRDSGAEARPARSRAQPWQGRDSAGRSPGMPLARASTGGSRRFGWRPQPPERPEAGGSEGWRSHPNDRTPQGAAALMRRTLPSKPARAARDPLEAVRRPGRAP